MLLAVCRSPLHVARLRFSSGTRITHVPDCEGSPRIWRQKIHLIPAKTKTSPLQRLKTNFPCADHRLQCVHLTEQCVHPRFSTSLQWISKISGRTNHPALIGAKLRSCNSRIFSLTRVLSERINTDVQLSTNGYCTASGKPEIKDDQKITNPETSQCASSTSLSSNQGQFKELYENPWTIPNILCMARIVLSPILGYLIIEQYFHVSLGLFALAGATDLLDGYIARNWPNQKSALGSALDPLADKILVSVLYISLTYAQLIPVPLTALVIARDVALIAAVFYVRYKTVPPPVTLSKFFNPCYTTAQLKPTLISKFNTAIQLILVAASLASPIFHYTDSVLLQSLWFVTALTTAASGYSYYHYGRKTVEVLNKRK